MPHIKGNKFKPKPAPGAEPAPQPQTASAGPSSGKAGKKARKQQRQVAASAAEPDVAVEDAAPGASAAAAAAAAAATTDDGSRPAKKRRQGAAAPTLPAIPTVVAPAPKPGAPAAAAAAAATSNWAVLKAAMDTAKQQQEASRPHWQRRQRGGGKGPDAGGSAAEPAVPPSRPQSIGRDTAPTKVVAIDCEMVGVGPNGERSALARVCVVNSAGNVLLDRFVRPKDKVTDFRTKVSGVRPSNLRDAPAFELVQREVAELLKGRIVVGHAIENDLEALLLSHGRKDVRDTAKYPPLMKVQARMGKLKPRALRHLAAEHLGLTIQEGEHSPVDDARAALYLYLKHRKEWERWVAAGGRQQEHPAVAKMLGAAAGGGLGHFAGGSRRKAGAQVPLSVAQLKSSDYMADF